MYQVYQVDWNLAGVSGGFGAWYGQKMEEKVMDNVRMFVEAEL